MIRSEFADGITMENKMNAAIALLQKYNIKIDRKTDKKSIAMFNPNLLVSNEYPFITNFECS